MTNILNTTLDILQTVKSAYFCRHFGLINKSKSTKEQLQKCFEKLIVNGDIIIDKKEKLPQLTIQGENLLYDVEKALQTQSNLENLLTKNNKSPKIKVNY